MSISEFESSVRSIPDDKIYLMFLNELIKNIENKSKIINIIALYSKLLNVNAKLTRSHLKLMDAIEESNLNLNLDLDSVKGGLIAEYTSAFEKHLQELPVFEPPGLNSSFTEIIHAIIYLGNLNSKTIVNFININYKNLLRQLKFKLHLNSDMNLNSPSEIITIDDFNIITPLYTLFEPSMKSIILNLTFFGSLMHWVFGPIEDSKSKSESESVEELVVSDEDPDEEPIEEPVEEPTEEPPEDPTEDSVEEPTEDPTGDSVDDLIGSDGPFESDPIMDQFNEHLGLYNIYRLLKTVYYTMALRSNSDLDMNKHLSFLNKFLDIAEQSGGDLNDFYSSLLAVDESQIPITEYYSVKLDSLTTVEIEDEAIRNAELEVSNAFEVYKTAFRKSEQLRSDITEKRKKKERERQQAEYEKEQLHQWTEYEKNYYVHVTETACEKADPLRGGYLVPFFKCISDKMNSHWIEPVTLESISIYSRISAMEFEHIEDASRHFFCSGSFIPLNTEEFALFKDIFKSRFINEVLVVKE